MLASSWGRPREIRAAQPVMAISAPSPVDPDPCVRMVRPHELDIVLPSCIAMFTEEVGVSPIGGDGGAAYRSRMADLIRSSLSFALIDPDGHLTFKPEIVSFTPYAFQVQGFWVPPEDRGRGHAVR